MSLRRSPRLKQSAFIFSGLTLKKSNAIISLSKFKVLLLSLFIYNISSAQVIQSTFAGQISAYSWYRNPDNVDTLGKSSGSAVYNLGPVLGFTIGTPTFGLLAKGNCLFNIFAFDYKENKGFSAFSFGATGLIYIGHPNDHTGFSILVGGGIQRTKTELWIHPKKYKGFSRPYFTTYVGEIAIRPAKWSGEYLFLRAGAGNNNSISFEAGIYFHSNFIQHLLKKD